MNSPTALQIEPPAHPTWLLNPAFAVNEAASLIHINPETLSGWMRLGRAMGTPFHSKVRSRRLLTAHDVYVAGALSALSSAGIACGADVIRALHVVTHPGGKPALPGIGETVQLNEEDNDGKPVARIEVDLGTIWMSLEPKLAEMTGR